MLIRPKFQVMTQEHARDYYSRLNNHACQDREKGQTDSYFIRRLSEINSYAKDNGMSEYDATIELTKIHIGDAETDDIKEIETGVYIGSWINIEHEFDYEMSANFDDIRDKKYYGKSAKSCYPSDTNHLIPFDYGVCDNPDQLLNYKFTPGDWGAYKLRKKLGIDLTPELEKELETEITLGDYLRNSDRKFAVGFNPIEQDPENPGGGWRWHKWGSYIGKHDVQYEYLDDEDLSDIGQNYILCFHIYEFKDAEVIQEDTNADTKQ